VDAVIVPIGGGGLISGVAYAIKSLNPNCKVYGVQSSGAPSMEQALAHHQVECLNGVCTIADGIAVKQPGDLTYSLCSEYVDKVVTVTDDEISTAILTLIEQQKLITEGAGAVSVASVLFDKLDLKGKKVVCLLSGGNIDVTILSRIISRGLLKAGRSADMTLELVDRPGQLKEVASIIAALGGNVVAVRHDRSGEGSDINGCTLHIVMETRNHQHIEEIRNALQKAGYRMVER
jgi:threonine dehydratase